MEGYIQGKQVISKKYSGKGVDQKFTLLPDDTSLVGGWSRHDSSCFAGDR